MDHLQYRHALAAQREASELAFADSEFEARQSRVRNAMGEAGLDALLLTDPSDIYYLTGYNTFEVSVHACLVCSPERLTLQVPSIETGPAVVTARVDELLGYRWEGIGEVIEPLVDTLAPFRAIGLDLYGAGLRHGVLRELQARLGAERFRDDGGELLDRIRIVKSEAELGCLRESARITSLGLKAAARVAAIGMLDGDVAAEGARAMLAGGSEFMSMQPIVTVGPRSSVIHLNHQRHRIAPGEPVFMEFGAAYRRYTAPMMKTLIAGTPSQEMLRTGELCRDLFEALRVKMRPGNTFDDAARAAAEVLAPHAERVFFSGVFGYAVGAQFPPSWVEGSGYIARGQQREFEAGMVFHLPLCLRIPGQWGIGLSDTVHVTPLGAEPLTDNDWQLESSVL
ncbi:MAG: Xaa-Pro peptidase family protein [Billgrantia sp.]|uniref:Aminopeptidase P family protein n=1 Tax=Billgrantia desiderata TaxID=52021 RepID=A0ABS9B657_9GAMM|nr:Xaa-Pro peptidase family protein [Halomonas desiderata]MCE8011480.1 aminopeptidase P family protein [Halomonas desiderata]MCE8043019.1 aminopeptidase P family protein [Halomonas desiderata]MCE8047465.1 aminopeptidase P family protein [Halomonas desiderata]OUE38777.1 Xaa-Pro aminopeptidase [Halomonas desiderata SP1]